MNSEISVETIYETMGEGLKKYIRASVRDIQLAEDIFQQIFLKIFIKLEQLKDSTKVHSWVYQIMRTTIIDAVRKQKSSSPLDESVKAGEEHIDFEKSSQMAERAIRALIETFPQIYREVLILQEFEMMKSGEIARQLSITLSAARSRLQRGKKMLKEKLEEFCIFELDTYGFIINYSLSEKARLYLKNKKII